MHAPLAPGSRALALTVFGLLIGCQGTPSQEPPDSGEPPEIAILSPDEGASLTTRADADRSVPIEFSVTGLTLKAPGTCLASDGPCGHVVVQVDGAACDVEGSGFNSVAVASPARAALGRCEVPGGPHTLTLTIARDDRSPWLRDERPIEASVAVETVVPPLLERLGGRTGLQALSAAMVERQLATNSINGYFRNASVDHDRMKVCMAAVFEQMVDPAGGAATALDCETDMASAHAGLGTSRADMDDWLQQFTEAGAAVGIPEADFAELLAMVTGAGADIIEDPDNNATLYQRFGRRPGLWTVVQTFATKLSMHAQVSRYFLNDEGVPEYSDVFAVCLMRLLGSLDGPFIYGEEFPLEPALMEAGRNCRGMVASHEDTVSAPPQSNPIGPDEFLEVALVLVAALEYHEVPPEDINLLVEAMNLPGLCSQIIANPDDCEVLFPPAD